MSWIFRLSLLFNALRGLYNTWAEPFEGGFRGHHEDLSEAVRAEKKEEFKALKEKWKTMSREEKLASIEEKRVERLKIKKEKFDWISVVFIAC